MASTVILLDVSLSMGRPYADFLPTKLAVTTASVAKAVSNLIEERHKVGLVFFASWVLPIVPPTRDQRRLYRALLLIDRTFEGSAPGEAIIEGIRLLRPLPDAEKNLVLITDGDYNIGIPLPYAIEAARLNDIKLHIVHIGDPSETKLGPLHEPYAEKAEWHIVQDRGSFMDSLLSIG
jgi:uncharacterized protein (DUF58 family)